MASPTSPLRRHEIETVFEAALSQPTRARDAWLAVRCGGDAALREEVAALLAAHERAAGMLERDVEAPTLPPDDAGGGRRIGAWRIIRELGRGGMGVVYLAERADGQFRQRGALKLLRGGPDAGELHRRFLAERQILASLSHPNIAQLLDGGVTDGELPYLVMEYVDGGVPITRYCDQHRLDVAARLRLFLQVCAAVHHAHQNLIIHRDLKPGNILVTADGTPKLLDFGIAKLLNPVMGGLDLPPTRTGFRAMTPEYASPEQVRGAPLGTPSDTYALGVVLYELLTGRRPHRLTSGDHGALAQDILEREPEVPSTRVARTEAGHAALGDEPPTLDPRVVSDARSTTPERLRRTLRGDLDAIVMMALRKEARHRYGSAELLAEDVQRFLDGLPVQAQKGSRWYRFRKLVARHRPTAAAAVIVTIALLGTTAVAVRQATLAGRERDRAEQALRESEELSSFLVGLFEAGMPEQARGGEPTARDLLVRGRARVETLGAQPLLQARMLEALGRVHAVLGELDESHAMLARSLALRRGALGERHPDVAASQYWLADVLRRLSRYQEADTMARAALATRQATLGPRHPSAAESQVQLAGLAVYLGDTERADSLARVALEIRREALGPTHATVATSLEFAAATARRVGDAARAESLLRESIELRRRIFGGTHQSVAYAMLRLADVLAYERGRFAPAESLYRAAISMHVAATGELHPNVVYARMDLATLLARSGRSAEAVALAESTRALAPRVFGPENPANIGLLVPLRSAYMAAGRVADAERLVLQELAYWEQRLGPGHASYAGALSGLSEIRREQRRWDEAEALQRRATEIHRRASGTETGLTALGIVLVARVAAQRGDRERAESLYQAGIAALRRHGGESHQDTRRAYGWLADLYEGWGRTTDAAEYRRRAQPR